MSGQEAGFPGSLRFLIGLMTQLSRHRLLHIHIDRVSGGVGVEAGDLFFFIYF